ncbi:MAG: cobalamin-dependent protein [Deltaproteobacteria bacterium]|nr:cobalamin-dependent protein [Deltaproteobacteria bacterium]
MKIALIGTNIVPKSQINNPAQYNIAIYFLAAYLRNAFKHLDLNIEIIDIPICVGMSKLPKEYEEKISKLNAHLYGFSSYCWDRDIVIKLIKQVKRNSNSTIVLGGPTATFEGLRLMQENEEIDFAVVGEGEKTLVDIIRSQGDVSNLKGLIFRRGKELCFNGHIEPVENLDLLPSPFIEGLLKPRETNLMLGFSRGCSNKCKHCAWKSTGGGIRYFSKKRVRQELMWAKQNNYRHIFIYDSAINSNTERLKELIWAVKSCKLNPDLSFTYFVDHFRWNNIHKELLKNINARCILVGLESVSREASLSLGRRPVDKSHFMKFVDSITDVGPIMISVMFGIPTETGRDFKNTIDYVINLVEKFGREKIIGIRIFWTIVTPGSRLSYEVGKYNIQYSLRGMPYVLSSGVFSRDDMISSLEYIQDHPYKELFIWEDINPKVFYNEIKSFDLLPECRERYIRKNIINLKGLIPTCTIGSLYYKSWRLDSIEYEHEYPVLKFRNQSDNNLIILKIYNKIANGPFNSKKYSILVGNDMNPRYNQDLKGICSKLLAEISRNE